MATSSRFLVYSDIHLHNWSYASRPVGGWNSRLLFQNEVLRQIEQYALDRSIKTIFFCGDLFHTHQALNAAPLKIAVDTFSRWKNHGWDLTFLVGNHDMASKDIHSLEALRPYGRVVDAPVRFTVGEIPVSAAPYTESDDSFKRFISNTERDSLVLCHQGVKGVECNNYGYKPDSLLTPDAVNDKPRLVFSGHFHSFKRVSQKLFIPGTPLAHDWSDVGEAKGFLDVDWDTASVKFVETDAPKFKRIDMGSTIVIKGDSTLTKMVEGNYIKIANLSHQQTPAVAREILLKLGAWSVEFEVEKSPYLETDNVWKQAWDTREMFDNYAKAQGVHGRRREIGTELITGRYEAIERQDN